MSNTTSRSSGLQTSTATITENAAILTGLNIFGAAADAVVIIYDNTSAAGTEVLKYTHDVSLNGLSVYIPLPRVLCRIGVHVVISGTGAEYIVHFA